MIGDVTLVGLDIGTTTSSAVVASSQLTRNAVTGRSELTSIHEIYRSETVLTPLHGDLLDETALAGYLDEWLAAGRVDPQQVFGGGALVTGLAAQRANAPAVVRTVRRRLENALIATANDPNLESWLAFMGSCAALSRSHPEIPIVNLDIGGGTTNLALGMAGSVLRTGCLRIGARHIQVNPGSYRIRSISRYAQELLAALRIDKGPGDCLVDAEVDAVIQYYISLLTSTVNGHPDLSGSPLTSLHEVSRFSMPRDMGNVAITVSGGVGALIYAHLNGAPWPSRTHYGDLGIDLAKRLLTIPWAKSLRTFAPKSAGRATVYGLLRHNTEVSGKTLFLPNPDCLPLSDVPILGVITGHSTTDDITNLASLAKQSHVGGCLRIDLSASDGDSVRAVAKRFSKVLDSIDYSCQRPLILLVNENVGKVLGNYITGWGTQPLNLVVIDEVTSRNAEYVQIGKIREQVVPVSFYGLHD